MRAIVVQILFVLVEQNQLYMLSFGHSEHTGKIFNDMGKQYRFLSPTFVASQDSCDAITRCDSKNRVLSAVFEVDFE